MPKILSGWTFEKHLSIDGVVVFIAIIGGIFSYAHMQDKIELHERELSDVVTYQVKTDGHLNQIETAISLGMRNESVLASIVAERTGKPVPQENFNRSQDSFSHN